jgi:NADPH:quinone reductase-like Zn-dependent oxidoreductase
MMRLDAPALIADAAPVPKPGHGEILVRIFAAGMTPTELLWYPTTRPSRSAVRILSAVAEFWTLGAPGSGQH